MKRIAFILTRAPVAPWTGRKMVLRTAIEAALKLGWQVHVFVLRSGGAANVEIPGCVVTQLHRSSFFKSVPQLVKGLLLDRRALNVCYFHSSRAKRALMQARGQFDVAYVDGIRCAQYAEALGCPWHLDMDDLLSERYFRFAEGLGESRFDFGFARSELPKLLARLPNFLMRWFLLRESRLIAVEELNLGRSASSVSLVSSREASELAIRSGVPVVALPMAVDVPRKADAQQCLGPKDVFRLGFVGPLYYPPNREALFRFCNDLLPEIRAALPFRIEVIHAGESDRKDLEDFRGLGVEFKGYVNSVADFFGSCDGVIAPIYSGTGVKTKVLEAACSGKPVLASTLAAEGTGMKCGEHFFECNSAGDYAEAIKAIRDDPGLVEGVVQRARQHVAQSFGSETVLARWMQQFRRTAGV